MNAFYGQKDSFTITYFHQGIYQEDEAIRFIGFKLKDETLIAYYKKISISRFR